MTGDTNAPEGHEAGRFGGTNPRGGMSEFSGGGNDAVNEGGERRKRRLGLGRRMMLPAEYADFVLADGRKLEDVLGKGFFQRFGRKDQGPEAAARARRLAERRTQAGRMGQTRSVLTGAQGVAGAADIARRGLAGR
jgi:hypothetical protein